MVNGGPSFTLDSIVFRESKPSVLFIDQDVSVVIHPSVCVEGWAGICAVGAGVGAVVAGTGVGAGVAHAPATTTARTHATRISHSTIRAGGAR